MKVLKDLTNIHGGKVKFTCRPGTHFLNMSSIYDEFSYEAYSGPAGVFSNRGFTDEYGTLHTDGSLRIVDMNGETLCTIDICKSGYFNRDFIITMS